VKCFRLLEETGEIDSACSGGSGLGVPHGLGAKRKQKAVIEQEIRRLDDVSEDRFQIGREPPQRGFLVSAGRERATDGLAGG